MYGVLDLYQKDPEGFCKAVYDLGYRYLEPCITVGPGLAEVPGFLDAPALEKLFQVAGAQGLKIEAAHIMVTDEANAVAIMKKLAQERGLRQFVFHCITSTDKEELEAFVQKMTAYADALAEAGAQLLLHNGGNDVGTKVDGISVYEWVLKKGAGKILAEPDTGWMLTGCGDGAGGEDPEAFFWRNAAVIGATHYKDFKPGEDGKYKECPVGEGLTDVDAIFHFSRAAEVIQYVDEDSSDDFMRDLTNAMRKFRELEGSWGETRSTLCIFDTETGDIQKLHTFDKVIEAPNWMKDGDHLIFNSDGLIHRYTISEDKDEVVNTGFCTKCNNDHVLAFDNSGIAVSNFNEDFISHIYTIPFETGEPFQVTKGNEHSWLHGWSPDGETLAFCGFRKRGEDQKMTVDIVTIPAKGGEEIRLTTEGFNDGPEYSSDGKTIWFISTRSGLMQVWKMNADGSGQQQMTFEDQNNWFGHISPDGKKVVNIAYSKDGLDPQQHLPNMHVSLWLMNADGSERRKILDFFGGQGSINVNSWAPDSKKFAFVQYELLHK